MFLFTDIRLFICYSKLHTFIRLSTLLLHLLYTESLYYYFIQLFSFYWFLYNIFFTVFYFYK